MKKYEFTSETICIGGHILHRIRSLIDIENFGVKTGDLGGFIEKETSLAHTGDAWVYGDAMVYGNAMVCDDALVYDNARVYGNAMVCDDARVYGNAMVCDDARVSRKNDILTIGPIGSRNDVTTFFRGQNKKIYVKCGRFSGTTDDFLEKVNKTHGSNKHAEIYKLATRLAIAQIDVE